MSAYLAGSIGTGIANMTKEVHRGQIQAQAAEERREIQTRQAKQDVITNDRNRLQIQQTEMQIEKMEMQMQQMSNENVKKNTHSAFSAYRVNGDTKYLNELLNSPGFNKVDGGVTGIYKIDPIADKDLLNSVGVSDEVMNDEDFDKARYVKTTRKTSKPGTYEIVDMYGIYAKDGYANVIQKEEVDEMAQKSRNIKLRQDKIKVDREEVEFNDMQDWKKKNPDKSLGDYKDAQNQGYKGKTQRTIDIWDKANPNATPEKRNAFINDLVNAATYGVGSNREDKDITTLTESQKKAIKMFEVDKTTGTNNYDEKEAILLENTIGAHLNSFQQGLVKDDLKDMKAHHNMAVTIDRILKDADKEFDGDEEVKKNLIANAEVYINSIFGNDTPQSLKNVRFNTASGLLLARFMKEISGTAVSENEVTRLQRIFQGGSVADISFVKEAMRTFSNESKEANKRLERHNRLNAPYSVNKYTTYNIDPDEPRKEQNEEQTKEQPKEQTKTYESQITKFKPLIGKVNPETGMKLVGINKKPPFSPIWEDTK